MGSGYARTVPEVLRLSPAEARRAAVGAQLLASPGPLGVAEVIARLGWLQIDPTAVVERTERLVLFSRIGAYDVGELDRLLDRARAVRVPRLHPPERGLRAPPPDDAALP